MNVLRKIRKIVKENEDTEIWLSQMALNTLYCDADIVRVAQKYQVIKMFNIEFVIEPGIEQKFEEENSYYRLETVQDLYQRKEGIKIKKLI